MRELSGTVSHGKTPTAEGPLAFPKGQSFRAANPANQRLKIDIASGVTDPFDKQSSSLLIFAKGKQTS